MRGPAGTLARVIRGEGFASALRRTGERIGDSLHHASMRARASFASQAPAKIVNISAAGIATRLGGVQAQLAARLREEKNLRGIALLHPDGLELSAPLPHARRIAGFRPTREFLDPAFEKAVGEALTITGARAIHLEGTDGVPLRSVLRLSDSGIAVIVSVHDFSLFCRRPHLLEEPLQHFCFYSRDLDRCLRCLCQSWQTSNDEQAVRRDLGRRLLASAAGVIFPSRFLLERHRDLFSLPELAAEIVEPGVTAPERTGTPGPRPAIAYAGSVQRHKGAHLMPEVIRLTGSGADWHIFGGGDEDLLRAMRRRSGVSVHGYYRQGGLPSLLERHRVGLIVLPSIVPESHSLVLSEARLSGAAAAAFDLGAPAERIREEGGGWLTPLESGAAGLAAIVDGWRSGKLTTVVPTSVPTPRAAAQAHMELYRKWQK